MNQSETIGELAKALVRVQANLEDPKKTANNPYYESKYADLKGCWDACRALLADNGLSVIQTMCTDGNPEVVIVRTTMLHTSGEWMRGDLMMKPTKPGPQQIGSCISYARRYALMAIVGISPEDDDGNAASVKPKGAKPKPEPPKKPDPPPKPNPQKKADEESSPIVQLWIKAEAADVPSEEWKLWCKEHAITKDRRTQGKKKLEILERKINEWKANSRDDKLFISEDELAWLRSTAEASAVDIQGEEGLLKFCQAAINNFELNDLKTLTKDDLGTCIKELNERSALEGSEDVPDSDPGNGDETCGAPPHDY